MTPELHRALWDAFHERHPKVSVDRMLCDPELRAAYLTLVRSRVGERPERDVLWGLVTARKKKSGLRGRSAPGQDDQA